MLGAVGFALALEVAPLLIGRVFEAREWSAGVLRLPPFQKQRKLRVLGAVPEAESILTGANRP